MQIRRTTNKQIKKHALTHIVQTHTHIHIHIQKYTCTHIQIHVHVHINTQAHTKKL